MVIGKNKYRPKFRLGDMELEITENYKYLGLIFNDKQNDNNHVELLRGKVEGAYQKMLTLTKDVTFSNIEMQTVWETVEKCIMPVITYGGETWELMKKQMREVNRLLDGVLKRILMVPVTTPRETLYIETGMMDPEIIIKRNRLCMEARIQRGDHETIKQVASNKQKGGWAEKNDEIKIEMGVEDCDLRLTKNGTKRVMREKSEKCFKEKIVKEGMGKAKVRHLLNGRENWRVNTRPEYMNRLTRWQASWIFKARTRMLNVKDNYRQTNQDDFCRLCREVKETQDHILEECPMIHTGDDSRVKETDIFQEHVYKLRDVAKKIESAMKKLTDGI